jgi:hypothetical protein
VVGEAAEEVEGWRLLWCGGYEGRFLCAIYRSRGGFAASCFEDVELGNGDGVVGRTIVEVD